MWSSLADLIGIKLAATAAAPLAPRDGTQSIRRAAMLVRVIASRSRTGLRLSEVVQHAHLERSTARRILKCLVDEGLVMQDAASHRYYLGPLVFELGLAASPQFNLVDICRESLQRIAEKTHDTVFLTVRSGYDSVCLDRREGSFPIKALMLEVGTRRPLGAGAGGLALLMLLPDEVVNEIVSANAVRFTSYNRLTLPSFMRMLGRARTLGYALNDIHITPGASSLGMPIVNRWGHPFAAISVGAIKSRMTPERQTEIADVVRTEVRLLERAMRDASTP